MNNTKITITVLGKEITLTLDEARAYREALNEIFSEKKTISEFPIPEYIHHPITMPSGPWDIKRFVIPPDRIWCGITPGSKSDAGL